MGGFSSVASRVAEYKLHEATSDSNVSAELLSSHEGVLGTNASQIQFNDLCFSPDGDVYATESYGSSVQGVSSGTLSTLTSGDILGDYDEGTHGNGIVYVEHADGDFLLVANYDGETLVKVDVETGAQSEVNMTVSFSGDGLVMLPDGRLVVVSSSIVYLLQPDSSTWTGASVQYSVDLGPSATISATTATLADTDLSVFVTTMRWNEALTAPTTDGSTMFRVEFPSLTTTSTTDATGDASTNETTDATGDASTNETTDATG